MTGRDRAQHAGWTALGEGRWTDARALFEDELAAAPDARALEGLSWAAWWLDDGAAVFRAREAAYGLYRSAGDARGAARMATWLAADQVDFNGASAVASGWLRRARRSQILVVFGRTRIQLGRLFTWRERRADEK